LLASSLPRRAISATTAGSARVVFPTVDAAVYNNAGEEVPPGGGGYLVIRKPWPAMLRGIYGEPKRYQETYWSRWKDTYFVSDGARIDEDGDFWLLGRVDDVMNVSGHRISTIEVESALVSHPAVAEAAVAGRNDAQTGQAIVAFVTLKGGKEGSPGMMKELRNHVGVVIGKFAAPANIVFTPELPKTRSGKIMRRLLRDVSENRPSGAREHRDGQLRDHSHVWLRVGMPAELGVRRKSPLLDLHRLDRVAAARLAHGPSLPDHGSNWRRAALRGELEHKADWG